MVSMGLEACGGSGHPLSGTVREGTSCIVGEIFSGGLQVGWPCNILKSAIHCRRKGDLYWQLGLDLGMHLNN